MASVVQIASPFLLLVWSSKLINKIYLALSDEDAMEEEQEVDDDEDDESDSKVLKLLLMKTIVDDRLYRAWAHVHVQKNLIRFGVVVMPKCRLTMDRLEE